MKKNILTTVTSLVFCVISTLPLLAEPASNFTPIIEQIRSQLPRGWVMRLPSSNIHLNNLQAYTFSLDTLVAVGLSAENCTPVDSSVCNVVTIYVSRSDPDELRFLREAQQKGARITLKSEIRGFYTSGMSASGEYHGVIWQQDGLIFRIFSRMGKSEVIDMALSMANQPPITSTISKR